MSDLVARLRTSVPDMSGAASAHCTDVEAVRLAADEIERLRAALVNAREYLENLEDYPEPRDAIERITAALNHGQSKEEK